MVSNIPFFRKLGDYIIRDIVLLLRPKRYESDSYIVERGDDVDCIFMLKSGCITVEVPDKQNQAKHEEPPDLYLDWLNEGSCFCVYTGFDS